MCTARLAMALDQYGFVKLSGAAAANSSSSLLSASNSRNNHSAAEAESITQPQAKIVSSTLVAT